MNYVAALLAFEANPTILDGLSATAEKIRESFQSLSRGLETLELYRKRTGATVSVVLDLRVRFRYSRLKEAALFAAGAMGFQSISVWKLLKRRVLAGRPSNRIHRI